MTPKVEARVQDDSAGCSSFFSLRSEVGSLKGSWRVLVGCLVCLCSKPQARQSVQERMRSLMVGASKPVESCCHDHIEAFKAW